MKTALFAAALLAGTAAFAQDSMHSTDPSMTTPPPVEATTSDYQDVTTAPTTAETWAASTGVTVAPDNSNPEHDARGIAVISDPASVPPGFNGTAATAVGGPLEPVAGDEYPACSRTITDNCLQTYERGRSPQ